VDYLDLFTRNPDWQGLLLVFLLGLFRLGPIVVLAPFFGAKLLPAPIKMGLILALGATFFPQNLFLIKETLHFNTHFAGLCLKEGLIGLLMGYLVGIAFYIANTSGNLIEHQRGSASLMITDPSLQIETSPVGLLYNYALIFLFFTIGGVDYLLNSLALSYNVIPLDKWLNPVFFQRLNAPFWQGIVDLGGQVISIATQLAAPPILTMLLADLFLGIANRMASQVPMAFLGWAFKSLVGMAILWLSWQFILVQLERQTIHWMKHLNVNIEQLATESAPRRPFPKFR
jgi:type III secretion protein T